MAMRGGMRGGVSRGGPVPAPSNMMQRPAPAAPGLQLPVQRTAAFNPAGGGMAKAGPGGAPGGMMGSISDGGPAVGGMSGGLQGAMQGAAPQAGGMMGAMGAPQMGGAMGGATQGMTGSMGAPQASSSFQQGAPPAALISALRGRMVR